jgi:DNA topoisomerase-3
VQAGWYAAYDGLPPGGGTEAGDPPEQELPELREGEEVRCVRVERSERASGPPPRLDDVTLLAALRGAGDAVTIERLIELGYVVRAGRGLRPTARGVQVVDLLGEHAITSLEPLWAFEQRLRAIERGEESRASCVRDAALAAGELVGYLGDLPAERTAFPRRDLALVCPRCGEGTLIENRKGYGCSTWVSREEPGCGFVIWKTIAGRPIDEAIVRELVAKGRTRELTGFRSRAGRPFRASLVLAPADEQPVTFAFGS